MDGNTMHSSRSPNFEIWTYFETNCAYGNNHLCWNPNR